MGIRDHQHEGNLGHRPQILETSSHQSLTKAVIEVRVQDTFAWVGTQQRFLALAVALAGRDQVLREDSEDRKAVLRQVVIKRPAVHRSTHWAQQVLGRVPHLGDVGQIGRRLRVVLLEERGGRSANRWIEDKCRFTVDGQVLSVAGLDHADQWLKLRIAS